MKEAARGIVRKLGQIGRMIRGTDSLSVREFVGRKYLWGKGIEIGALDKPMKVPSGARVEYADRFSVQDLRRQYPEMESRKLVPVKFVVDGETLSGIPDDSMNFVIANHFLEHCQNPILAMQNMLRVVAPGGSVFLAVPDMRFTFDVDRTTTSFNHLLADYHSGPENSKVQHYLEWVEKVVRIRDPHEIFRQATNLMKKDYSIHFHTWTQTELLEFLVRLKTELRFSFEVELFLKNGDEVVMVLSKPV